MITYEIWILVYHSISIFVKADVFDLVELIKEMLFIKANSMSHMWYMPMIIGIYFSVPFISLVVKNFSINSLILPFCISFLNSFLIPNINIGLNYLGAEGLDCILILNFLGGE